MAHVQLPMAPRRFGQTMRTDNWWIQPAAVLIGLSLFATYLTWAAFQGAYYTSGPYLSPLYSPELFGSSEHALFGPQPSWWPGWLPFSPAFLILWAPGGFRFTCYYYRGAYYKAFWADPPNCAVGEPRKGYLGERHFPLILQNVHRWFMYLAMPILLILLWDVFKAMRFASPAGGTEFGIGVGTVILAVNLGLLSSYTIGCHSFRHFWGGKFDRVSEHPARKVIYDCSTCLNRSHMRWAWLSLFSVTFSDLYIRLCAMGVWSDFRIL